MYYKEEEGKKKRNGRWERRALSLLRMIRRGYYSRNYLFYLLNAKISKDKALACFYFRHRNSILL